MTLHVCIKWDFPLTKLCEGWKKVEAISTS